MGWQKLCQGLEIWFPLLLEPKLFCMVNVVSSNVVPTHILGSIVDLQAIDVFELPICPKT